MLRRTKVYQLEQNFDKVIKFEFEKKTKENCVTLPLSRKKGDKVNRQMLKDTMSASFPNMYYLIRYWATSSIHISWLSCWANMTVSFVVTLPYSQLNCSSEKSRVSSVFIGFVNVFFWVVMQGRGWVSARSLSWDREERHDAKKMQPERKSWDVLKSAWASPAVISHTSHNPD